MPRKVPIRYARISNASVCIAGTEYPYEQYPSGQVFYWMDGIKCAKPLKLNKDCADAEKLVRVAVDKRVGSAALARAAEAYLLAEGAPALEEDPELHDDGKHANAKHPPHSTAPEPPSKRMCLPQTNFMSDADEVPAEIDDSGTVIKHAYSLRKGSECKGVELFSPSWTENDMRRHDGTRHDRVRLAGVLRMRHADAHPNPLLSQSYSVRL